MKDKIEKVVEKLLASGKTSDEIVDIIIQANDREAGEMLLSGLNDIDDLLLELNKEGKLGTPEYNDMMQTIANVTFFIQSYLDKKYKDYKF